MPKSQKFPIDLGKTLTEQLGGPVAAGVPPEKEGDTTKYYPSIGLEWDKPYDLPESGTMTVKFKRTSETNSKRPDGKTSQRVELDLTSIESVDADEVETNDDEEDTGDVLDKAKDALEKKSKRKRLPADDSDEEEAPEPRDTGFGSGY